MIAAVVLVVVVDAVPDGEDITWRNSGNSGKHEAFSGRRTNWRSGGRPENRQREPRQRLSGMICSTHSGDICLAFPL